MFDVRVESVLGLVTYFIYYKGGLLVRTTDEANMGRILIELASDLSLFKD